MPEAMARHPDRDLEPLHFDQQSHKKPPLPKRLLPFRRVRRDMRQTWSIALWVGRGQPRPLTSVRRDFGETRTMALRLLLAYLLLSSIGCDPKPPLDPEWVAQDLMSKAMSADFPAQFEHVLAMQASRSREPALTESLASQLVGSRRQFAKNREKGRDGDDLIGSAKVRPDGRVAFTYRRARSRIGLQIGYVNRIGTQVLFTGRWFQQSKMDGGGCGCDRARPSKHADFSVEIDGDSARKQLRYLDEGAFIYYGSVVDGSIVLLYGKDLNLRDQVKAHESWLDLRPRNDR